MLIQNGQQAESMQGMWNLPQTIRIYKEDQQVDVPTDSLRYGDQIIVNTGEMVPVDGVICEGNAWLRSRAAARINSTQVKEVGDSVMTTDIVLIGQICVQVGY